MGENQEQLSALATTQSSGKKVGFKLQQRLPPINYDRRVNYDSLVLFNEEIKNREMMSREEAHKMFMDNYHMIFEEKPETSLTHTEILTEKAKRPLNEVAKEQSHNIGDHLAKLHRHRASPMKEARLEELTRKIRKWCKKPPFERTSKENQQLARCLMHVGCFADVPKKILQKLVSTAYLEKWETNFTVFGDSGLYLIIKGSCTPYPAPSLPPTSELQRNESADTFDIITDSPLSRRLLTLVPGDHFGRLEENDESEDFDSNVHAVTTLENCELLRFSTTSYKRVAKQVKDAEYDAKLQLAQSCKLFKDWPNLSLKRISEIFQWAEIPAGEKLAKEGDFATRIFFIKSGVCQLKNTLSVAFTGSDGKKIRRRKEVVTGTLETGDSFGEKNLMLEQAFEQSVVSETPLVVATIDLDDIDGLDEVTRALFQQTCEATGSGATEASIKKKYVEKQAELEWKSKKDAIVNDVLYYNGIMPGYSKWSRNPNSEEVKHLYKP